VRGSKGEKGNIYYFLEAKGEKGPFRKKEGGNMGERVNNRLKKPAEGGKREFPRLRLCRKLARGGGRGEGLSFHACYGSRKEGKGRDQKNRPAFGRGKKDERKGTALQSIARKGRTNKLGGEARFQYRHLNLRE